MLYVVLYQVACDFQRLVRAVIWHGACDGSVVLYTKEHASYLRAGIKP